MSELVKVTVLEPPDAPPTVVVVVEVVVMTSPLTWNELVEREVGLLRSPVS